MTNAIICIVVALFDEINQTWIIVKRLACAADYLQPLDVSIDIERKTYFLFPFYHTLPRKTKGKTPYCSYFALHPSGCGEKRPVYSSIFVYLWLLYTIYIFGRRGQSVMLRVYQMHMQCVCVCIQEWQWPNRDSFIATFSRLFSFMKYLILRIPHYIYFVWIRFGWCSTRPRSYLLYMFIGLSQVAISTFSLALNEVQLPNKIKCKSTYFVSVVHSAWSWFVRS